MTPDDIRAIVATLPQTEERETWGEATFRVRDKIIVMVGPDGERASLKASLLEQQALIARDPDTFSVAPYVGRHGWISVRLATVDPIEMSELITEAWRMTAPKSMVKEFDAKTTLGRGA